MRAGTAPRVVLPRVRLVLTSLPVRAGTASRVAQPAWSSSFLLLDISTCRRRHHSVAVLRITVVVSARAVTARPEAPECFSPSQPSSFNRRLSSAKLSTTGSLQLLNLKVKPSPCLSPLCDLRLVSSRNYPSWIARSLALPFRFNHYLFASFILGEFQSRLSALPLSGDLNTLSCVSEASVLGIKR
uniref:Uncharacterized protein n=3 Tax=Brassica campestris TaxID=3711 RepID=M4CUI5_BRACM